MSIQRWETKVSETSRNMVSVIIRMDYVVCFFLRVSLGESRSSRSLKQLANGANGMLICERLRVSRF